MTTHCAISAGILSLAMLFFKPQSTRNPVLAPVNPVAGIWAAFGLRSAASFCIIKPDSTWPGGNVARAFVSPVLWLTHIHRKNGIVIQTIIYQVCVRGWVTIKC